CRIARARTDDHRLEDGLQALLGLVNTGRLGHAGSSASATRFFGPNDTERIRRPRSATSAFTASRSPSVVAASTENVSPARGGPAGLRSLVMTKSLTARCMVSSGGSGGLACDSPFRRPSAPEDLGQPHASPPNRQS